jgi:multicomponent K+:H+ antiporter subunit D
MRSGINTFWVSFDGVIPAIRAVELAPILMLLGLGLVLTVYALPVMRFMEAAANSLYTGGEYTRVVLGHLPGAARQ